MSHRRILPVVVAGAFLALATSCTRHDDDVRAKLKDAYADARAAVAEKWQDLKDYTYEKRAAFCDDARAMGDRMDAKVEELKRSHGDSGLSDRKKAALEELRKCQADFRAKVDAVGRASADTWEAARKGAADSWERLKAAYEKAGQD